MKIEITQKGNKVTASYNGKVLEVRTADDNITTAELINYFTDKYNN